MLCQCSSEPTRPPLIGMTLRGRRRTEPHLVPACPSKAGTSTRAQSHRQIFLPTDRPRKEAAGWALSTFGNTFPSSRSTTHLRRRRIAHGLVTGDRWRSPFDRSPSSTRAARSPGAGKVRDNLGRPRGRLTGIFTDTAVEAAPPIVNASAARSRTIVVPRVDEQSRSVVSW